MRIIVIFFIAILAGAFTNVQAQTADEIIDAYFENTGGKDNWRNLKGMQIDGVMKMQGMEIGLNVVSLKDGRQYSEITVQGKQLKQGVYDGEKMWGINFMTGQAEEMEKEMVDNFKINEANDFPDPLLDYKEKGYTVELLGQETMEGTECHKIKLTKKPVMRDGKSEEVVTIYYFDTENMVPIAEEMVGGPMQGPPGSEGQKMISTMSDYQEVNGLYFPFSRTMPQGEMIIKEIAFDPEVSDDAFAMPAPVVEEENN